MAANKHTKKQAEHIFDRWKSGLREKSRKVDSVFENFAELVDELWRVGADFELAKEILEAATIVHYPSKDIVRRIYKQSKMSKDFDDEKAFEKSWREIIRDHANNAFFDIYEIPGGTDETKPAEKVSIFNVDKKTGQTIAPNGLPKEEYRKIRRYVESFPLINTDDLPDLDEASPEEREDLLKGLGAFDGKN